MWIAEKDCQNKTRNPPENMKINKKKIESREKREVKNMKRNGKK